MGPITIVLASIIATASAGGVPWCAVTNKWFGKIESDNPREWHALPSAQECQYACQNQPTCKAFTWLPETGGCFMSAHLADEPFAATMVAPIDNVISGPKFCHATKFELPDPVQKFLVVVAVALAALGLLSLLAWASGTRMPLMGTTKVRAVDVMQDADEENQITQPMMPAMGQPLEPAMARFTPELAESVHVPGVEPPHGCKQTRTVVVVKKAVEGSQMAQPMMPVMREPLEQPTADLLPQLAKEVEVCEAQQP